MEISESLGRKFKQLLNVFDRMPKKKKESVYTHTIVQKQDLRQSPKKYDGVK